LSKMQEPKGIPYFLVGNSEGAKIRQTEFDKYLELAFRHKIIDKNLKSKLKSNKWEIFYQAHQELMCFYFIEKILNYKISIYPKGLNNSILDCLLEYSKKENIYIEIKAPIREITDVVWPGNDSDAIKSNIKKARKQMSADSKNIIILAPDLKDSISDDKASGIIEALYGSPLEKPQLSGIFKPTVNTRIGAVATLEDFMCSPNFEYLFKVYHNPYSKNPIDKKVFKGWPQFFTDREKNRRTWINNKNDC